MADVDGVLSWVEPGWAGVEIGVLRGWSARALLEHGAAHLCLIDPWHNGEEYYQEVLRQLAGFEGRYRVLRMTSEEAAPFVPEVDFVWVDGDHHYEVARRDLGLYWPKVRPGGVLCGHDYFDSPPDYGVKTAVDEFCAANGLTASVIHTPGGSLTPCWAVRKGAS